MSNLEEGIWKEGFKEGFRRGFSESYTKSFIESFIKIYVEAFTKSYIEDLMKCGVLTQQHLEQEGPTSADDTANDEETDAEALKSEGTLCDYPS